MFKNKSANNGKMFGRLTRLIAVPLLLFELVGQQAGAQVTCGCNTTACGVSFSTGGVPIQPGSSVPGGTVVVATVQISPQAVCAAPNQALLPCEFHHGAMVLNHPDGFVEVLSADLPTTTGSGTPLTFVSTHPVTLNTGGFALWTMTYGNPANPAPDALDGSWITPSGEQLGAAATCSQGLDVILNPSICLTKEVACSPPGGVCDGSLPYAETATGVANSADPAFCYRITVLNCGPIGLTNVTVSDPDLGGILAGFPSSLAPGQSATGYFQKAWGVGTHVNTATTSGIGVPGGDQVTTNDTATAIVLSINIVCDLTLGSSFDMDNNTNDNHVTLPAGSVDTPITFNLTLSNTGTSPLNVTTINGLPSLVDCSSGSPIAVPLPINIPAGGTVTISGCVNVSCPGTQFSVTAHAEADDQGGTLCVYDSQGNRIADDTTPCAANVTCENPVTCRVTGGGVLLPGFVDQSCIEVNTTIFPFTSPNGLTIKKITHGGQLGAPFSQMDCGAILGNPCIRGQWQHTRHYEGKANPRDVFDMDFHSQTPKGQYDSLSCACLGCCDPATGAFIPPSLGPLIHKFQLCNPDDHKVCGPQPRPSPANAIIWSGIGKVTPVDDVRGSRAAQAEWVVFRVYIEDRSEPGGGHPGGAVEPADIYCFQAWKTGITVSKKPDFSTIAAAFRLALGEANCDFLAGLESGAFPIGTLPSATVGGVTADIQDCGPLHDGNHQIHPSTGATCP